MSARTTDVGGEEPAVPLQERLEAGRADLLLALDEELEVQGQPARGLEPGAHRGDVGDEGALVVHRSPPVEAPVALGRLEGRRHPLLRPARRLHVVVAVDEQRGRARGVEPVRVDVGVLARHLEEAHVLEAGLAQEGRGRLGRAAHLLGREALGGDARDADEVGQARLHLADVRLGVAERGVDGSPPEVGAPFGGGGLRHRGFPSPSLDEAGLLCERAPAGAGLSWAMGTPELARAFGDVSAMPTLLLFDGGSSLRPGVQSARHPAMPAPPARSAGPEWEAS